MFQIYRTLDSPILVNYTLNILIFSSPRNVFESLRYQPGVCRSFFLGLFDDYVALENSFQGINLSNGMEFGLVSFMIVTLQKYLGTYGM